MYNEILEEMDTLLDKAVPVPLSGKKVVDQERFRELINDLRLHMPPEIKKAKQIMHDKQITLLEAQAKGDEIIRNANSQAEDIIRRAEDHARTIVSNDAIVQGATAEAARIRSEAVQLAKTMLKEVDDSLDKTLNESMASLATGLQRIQEVKDKRTRSAVR